METPTIDLDADIPQERLDLARGLALVRLHLAALVRTGEISPDACRTIMRLLDSSHLA